MWSHIHTHNIHWEPPNTDTFNLFRSVQQKHNFPFYSNRGKWLASKIHKTTVWQAHFWRRWPHIELPKSIVRSILGGVGVMDVSGCGLSAGALQVTQEQEAPLLQMPKLWRWRGDGFEMDPHTGSSQGGDTRLLREAPLSHTRMCVRQRGQADQW